MSVPPSHSGGRGGEAALRTELERQLAEARASQSALKALLEEQRRTEAALRASEALLKSTGDIARIGSWELDAVTLAVRWTDQVYVIHEVPVGGTEVLAKAIDFYHPDDRPKITAAVQTALERGESFDLELRLITAKGRKLWVRSSGRAVSEAGRVVRLTGTFQDITERKLAYEKLDQLIGTVDGVVWEADVTTFAFTYVSHQAERIFGYPLADWTATPDFWMKHLHPEDRDSAASFCMAETTAGRNFGLEYRMFRADGQIIWIHELVSVISENGRLRSMRGLLLDITERKLAELTLRETEARYRSLFSLAPDPIMLISTEPDDLGRILDANDLAASVHGYEREELLTMTVFDLDTPESARYGRERIERMMAGERLVFEVEHRRKDGSVFPNEVTASRVDFAGRVCVLAFNRDITERKQAEAALRDSEERWQFALEAAQGGIWDWNVETGAAFFSARWKSMLGFANDEIRGSFDDFAGLVHPDDLRELRPALEAHLAGREPAYGAELRMRCKDGSWKWIQARGKVIERAADGAPRRMIGTHTDIDEPKRREEHERVLSRRLDLALSAGRFGTFELDLKTGRSLWDRRAFEIFGMEPQAEGPGLEEIEAMVQAEDRALFQEIIAAARLGHDTPAREFQIRTATGEERTVMRRAVVRRAKDGSGLGTTGVLEDVTALRTAERERRRELDRYNTIFNAVGSGLILQQSDGAIIEANPVAEKILGLTRAQLLGRDPLDPRWRFVDASGAPIPEAEIPAEITLRTGQSVRNRAMGVHWPDGPLVWLSVSTEPIFDAEGRVAQVAVSFIDTTAQHLADERLRIMLRASRMGVWRHNLRTELTEWDARMFEIFGWTDTPPDHAGFMAMVLAEDRAVIDREWERVKAGQVDFEYIFRVRRPNGEVRSIRSVGTAQRDAAGELDWMGGINEDITERLAAEADHQLDSKRLEMAVKSTRLGIWRYDVVDRTSYWSEKQREIFGVERALTEPEFEAMIHPEDREKVVGLRARALAGEKDLVINFRIIRPDGRLVHIYSNMALWSGPDGSPRWIAGINQDVTEQVRQNEREQTLREQLLQSQKLETLGTLAGGIAHDFNNLLTGILGFVELAHRSLPKGHEVQSHLDFARGGGLRARDLVKRLLLFARRAPATERRPVQLEQIVSEALPLLAATFPPSIGIQRELAADVGRVMGDAGQLQQVIMNLCVNAAHAIGQRPGRITLTLRPAENGAAEALGCAPGQYVCVAVADTGRGMDAATQTRIFDPFFTTKQQGEGTGLGLSIVHGIVQEHGGGIQVRSDLDRGSVFEVYLPVTPEPMAGAAPEAAVEGEPVGDGRRVMVVDDEASIRLLTQVLLERAGFSVEVRPDAESAALVFAAAPSEFALVLADLSMPRRTGAELLRELRAIRPELPAILMSGDHERFGRSPSAELPGVVRLVKPFSAVDLFSALRYALDTKPIAPSV